MVIPPGWGKGLSGWNGLSVGEEQEQQVSTQEFLNQSGSFISKEPLPTVSAGSYPLCQMKSSSRPYRPNASGHAVLAT